MTVRKPKRLWWQTPDTAAWFFWLGGLWVLLAASQWWGQISRDGGVAAWRFILPVLCTGIAIAQLVAAVRRRRRERAGSVRQLQADHAAHDHQQEGDLQR